MTGRRWRSMMKNLGIIYDVELEDDEMRVALAFDEEM